MVMKRAFRDEWVAALLSGEFKQGSGYLAVISLTSTFHCCLGVRAELDCRADPSLPRRAIKSGNNTVIAFAPEYTYGDPYITMPSKEVLARWGLEDIEARYLAALNDRSSDFSSDS